VTSLDLAISYLKKAEARIDILEVLNRKAAYSDVVREAQEDIDFIPTEEYTSAGPWRIPHCCGGEIICLPGGVPPSIVMS